jgi:uncharacterized RmlC-like cupin family protein
VIDTLLPENASPPLHTHPQSETLVVLEGELTAVLDGTAIATGAGSAFHAPAGVPHTFRVESDVARVLVLSTPAGIERFARDASVPAERATLPPADAPRPSADELLAIEREHGVERLGPPLAPDD